MNSSERFKQTMHYGAPDRALCFEEGIRDDVIAAWRQQGLTKATELKRMFTYDERIEIEHFSHELRENSNIHRENSKNTEA